MVSHQIYNKVGKSIQERIKESLHKWCWENWTATCKRIKSKHSLTPYTHTKMLKMDYIPKCKVEYYKTLTEKHRQKTP